MSIASVSTSLPPAPALPASRPGVERGHGHGRRADSRTEAPTSPRTDPASPPQKGAVLNTLI